MFFCHQPILFTIFHRSSANGSHIFFHLISQFIFFYSSLFLFLLISESPQFFQLFISQSFFSPQFFFIYSFFTLVLLQFISQLVFGPWKLRVSHVTFCLYFKYGNLIVVSNCRGWRYELFSFYKKKGKKREFRGLVGWKPRDRDSSNSPTATAQLRTCTYPTQQHMVPEGFAKMLTRTKFLPNLQNILTQSCCRTCVQAPKYS